MGPQKKRPLILFEILIALSLTAILLTFLFSFFVESVKIEKKLETARMAASARGHLQTRIQDILTSLCQDKPNFFYTKQIDREKNVSLVFIFDHGIDPDPAFSGACLGRIFLDEKDRLSLAIWPLEKKDSTEWRKEILLLNVERFEFEFLGENKTVIGKIKALTPDLAWFSTWSQTATTPPSIIRLKVLQKKEKERLEFAFILPTSVPIVTYSERKVS